MTVIATQKSSKKSNIASQFEDLLNLLEFTKKGNVFSKTVNGSQLKVDVEKETISYPIGDGLVVNDKTTCNFTQPENLVVFECVHRLLSKGYKAKSLELEPRWKLGHGASGGKADILIKDMQGHELLIIECKNSGSAFTRAWNDMKRDGAQLFSYAQQISKVKFLCLYASDWSGDSLGYESLIIAHTDNAAYLRLNPGLKGFAEATDVKSRFSVWRDTYKYAYTPVGLFEETIPAYQIGKEKYTLSDLTPIGEAEEKSMLHSFLSILRQHNISSRENAFDKLVNLLLCKLVDELDNPDDLKFFWKGIAYENHFELLDRLQLLYQLGMHKFLGEDITYINQDDVANAMRFIKQSPDATQDAVWQLFIMQKFYTNNDFSLIDVHNEKLFYENAEVLLKLIQMWQTVRLTNSSSKSQFLGDLFEQFLDQGVKQSEGQFFTPKPLCRFIASSLPLPELLERVHVPRTLDYACGAGHFLNELADQLVETAGDYPEYHAEIQKSIFGIEKEYRLSKVAKVAAFMHGHRGINIAYADALIHDLPAYPEIKNDSFDVLVANPPYSVRGFLETLTEEQRGNYDVGVNVTDLEKFGSIETFFVERAAQLMRAGAIAGIILPSGILNNEGVYTRAREILLRSFEIVSIVELGNRTFGKTGTTTVTLFLRRRATTPDDHKHFEERVSEWFNAQSEDEIDQSATGPYADRVVLERYAKHIGATYEDYRSLLVGEPNETLLEQRVFKAYRTMFDDMAIIKKLTKSARFKGRSQDEQAMELQKAFLAEVVRIEQRKIAFFMLAESQQSNVLVIRAPSANDDQKRFLGYSWSSSKEAGGIHIDRDEHGNHVTPMYDETDRFNADKLSRYISDNFNGRFTSLPTSLKQYGFSAPLQELINFQRADFDLKIELAEPSASVAEMYRWPVAPLQDVADLAKGTSITESTAVAGDIKVIAGGKSFNYTHNVSNRGPGVITVSASGASAGFINYWDEPIFASDCSTITAKTKTQTDTKFLYYVLKGRQPELFRLARGSGQPHVYPQHLESVLIPAADQASREALVQTCDAIEIELSRTRSRIREMHLKLQELINAVESSKTPHRTIASISESSGQYGLNFAMDEHGTHPLDTPIFRMNEIIEGRLVDNGRMKTVGLAVDELAKYRLNKGDILFNRTNSREHVGKAGLFDLEGDYVFASYLVRIVPKRSEVDPRFLALMMAGSKFRETAKSVATPSINQANINATKMGQLTIPVPKCPEQEHFLKNAEELQREVIGLRLAGQQLEQDRREAIESLLGSAPALPGSTTEEELDEELE